MAIFTIPHITIAGVAATVPKQKEANIDYDWITLKERKRLIKTTGIEQRRVADKAKLATSDLCFQSAEVLLKDLNWDNSEVGILIFISQDPDYLLPATSIVLQHRLGLGKDTIAFDINLGCSGYIYGITTVATLMKNAGITKGLLLVGDISTATTSPKDKSTYPLFGDAGSATALQLIEADNIGIHAHLQSDGSGYQAIMVPDGGARNRINEDYQFEYKEESKGIIRHGMHTTLHGIDIFNFTLREVPNNIRKLLAYTDCETSDIDYFIFHQANLLINETIRKKLKIPKEKVPYSLKDFGNTSSASIPLTIVVNLQQALLQKPSRLLLAGFGVGLSWGSLLIDVPQVVCSKLIEI